MIECYGHMTPLFKTIEQMVATTAMMLKTIMSVKKVCTQHNLSTLSLITHPLNTPTLSTHPPS